MTRADYIAAHDLCQTLEARGVAVKGSGRQRMARCPFHDDKQASLSINVDQGVWNCHAGCGGGSVIDLIAKFDGKDVATVLREAGVNGNGNGHVSGAAVQDKIKPTIKAKYSYRNERGQEVYQAIRLEPKSFRQRRAVDGKWVWNMDGVTRVLYRLHEALKAETVWIVEGEKDADNLVALGFEATTNVGGAGKWLDSYSDVLAGKQVILCGDNDKPGQEHIEKVFDSLAGRVKWVKVITVPGPPKDVSDYIATFGTPEQAKAALDDLVAAAPQHNKGLRVPVYTMGEIQAKYRRHVNELGQRAVDLGKWLPTLGKRVRSLVPGDMVLVIGDTGIGKTALIMNFVMAALPMTTVLFEMELAIETMFERFMARERKISGQAVEDYYKAYPDLDTAALDKSFPGLVVCDKSGLTVEEIDEIIGRSELKLGEPPKLVGIDYVQLMAGKGERYERMSDTAEKLKVLAKRRRIVLVVASQVKRPEKETGIHLHSGKDSGSLENSAGLVLGAWRDTKDRQLLYLSILKNTKGHAWTKDPIKCNYNGEQSLITERSEMETENDGQQTTN